MLLTIDNLDGAGARDYTAALAPEPVLGITRKLNEPSTLTAALVSADPQFVVPASGGRVLLQRNDGVRLFTGYLVAAPEYEYQGWGERGPAYIYMLSAVSDEWVLDRKLLPARSPFVNRSAGNMLQLLHSDAAGTLDTSGVQSVGTSPVYAVDTELKWSKHAAAIAQQARAAYRAHDGKLTLAPLGGVSHSISESASGFTPASLKLQSLPRLVNDLTVTGEFEPEVIVRDYFLGDSITTRFTLSHQPFTRRNRAIFEEEYGAALAPQRWAVADPSSAVAVSGGKLTLNGGTGLDGQTLVQFVEQVELGGAQILQHGEVTVSAASNAVLGGLYIGSVASANCLTGFRIIPSGAQSAIQAWVNGAATGSVITTVAGHRYRLTTRIYANEAFRMQPTFYSSARPAGNGRGGAAVGSDARVVLEVHEIDPSSGGSFSTDSTTLYDNVLSNAPGYCAYAVVNAQSGQYALAYTRLLRAIETEVRSQLPNSTARTRLVGSILDGAECTTDHSPQLQFYSQYVPALSEAIVVRYRGRSRAFVRLTDSSSIAGNSGTNDDGVRASVVHAGAPRARTKLDCENASLALLDDLTGPAWKGGYDVPNDLLPNGPASDVWPGDAVAVSAPSRNASVAATVREVVVQPFDPRTDRYHYRIGFANDAAAIIALAEKPAHMQTPLDVTATVSTAGTEFIADLANAIVTTITSTTVSVDLGTTAPAGGGFEVRLSDANWGAANDRNLVGRYTTQTFTLTRFTRLITYFVKQYDATGKYSRNATALHVDYPLS